MDKDLHRNRGTRVSDVIIQSLHDTHPRVVEVRNGQRVEKEGVDVQDVEDIADGIVAGAEVLGVEIDRRRHSAVDAGRDAMEWVGSKPREEIRDRWALRLEWYPVVVVVKYIRFHVFLVYPISRLCCLLFIEIGSACDDCHLGAITEVVL